MDAAAVFLAILVVFCVFQGMLIARVRGLANEIDILKSALPGSSLSSPVGSVASGTASGLSPEAVAALAAAIGGADDGK